MDELRRQIQVLADELNSVRAELVASKQAHANLHQTTVDDRQRIQQEFADQTNRIRNMEDAQARSPQFNGGKEKSLIEAKQVTVPEFAGAVTDSRAKFLEWSEKIHPRCACACGSPREPGDPRNQ